MAIKQVNAKHIEAAGILFYARSTGNFLLLYRSANVVDGSCWCGAGGKIEEGESPEEAARREIDEEIGFDTYEAGVECVPLYTHRSDTLTFYNFLGVVEEQFFPELNWESDGYVWAPLENLPKPFHYGFQEILDDPEAKDLLDMAIETRNGTDADGDKAAAPSMDGPDGPPEKAELREDLATVSSFMELLREKIKATAKHDDLQNRTALNLSALRHAKV